MSLLSGMYEDKRTGQLLPILIGTTMKDLCGTELDVPILGAERNKQTSNIRPLGGTMEDPEGGGKDKIKLYFTLVLKTETLATKLSVTNGIT